MKYYDINALNDDLEVLKGQGAKVFSVGRSVLGRDIMCVFKGSAEGPQILLHGSVHAREYITTPLVIEMMKNYSGEVGVWCVPMANPDGVMLCQFGTESVSDKKLKEFIVTVNNDSADFSQWKANARAVDINVNFNADWGTGSQNLTYPSPGNYIGEYPESEPETRALCELTMKVQPFITLSYHARGNVIFWGYDGEFPYPEASRRISEVTGYPLLPSDGSAGGYKDWFVLTTKKIGLTVEVGSDDMPIPVPLENLPQIYQSNKDVLDTCAEISTTIWKQSL